jgi:biopolymer transport protein ExbD
MAGGANNDDDEIITAINVTPLVDIVLVLLIILMVTASYLVTKSIPMDLPSAQSGEDGTPRELTVSLDQEDHLYLNGEPTTWEALETAARRFAHANQEPRAVIEADRRVQHGEFIHVVDVLRTAGITRYAINVNPQDLQHQGE